MVWSWGCEKGDWTCDLWQAKTLSTAQQLRAGVQNWTLLGLNSDHRLWWRWWIPWAGWWLKPCKFHQPLAPKISLCSPVETEHLPTKAALGWLSCLPPNPPDPSQQNCLAKPFPRQNFTAPFTPEGGKESDLSHPQLLNLKSGNFRKDEIQSLRTSLSTVVNSQNALCKHFYNLGSFYKRMIRFTNSHPKKSLEITDLFLGRLYQLKQDVSLLLMVLYYCDICYMSLIKEWENNCFKMHLVYKNYLSFLIYTGLHIKDY